MLLSIRSLVLASLLSLPVAGLAHAQQAATNDDNGQSSLQMVCPITNGDCYPNGQPAFNAKSVWQWQAAQVHNFVSSLGAAVAEVNTAFNAVMGTGYTADWKAGTAYIAKDERVANDALYVQTAEQCVSEKGSKGPSGRGTSIADGTCLWNYETSVHNVAKVNLGVFTRVPRDTDPAHPKSSSFNWGIYNNLLIQGSHTPVFWSGLEIAVTNDGPNCPIGPGHLCTGMLIDGFLRNQGGIAININPQSPKVWRARTGYQRGQQAIFNNNQYVQTSKAPDQAPGMPDCVSGPDGGPRGNGSQIADGSCKWTFQKVLKPAWVYGLLFNGHAVENATIAIEDDAKYGIALGDITAGKTVADASKGLPSVPILHEHAIAAIFDQTKTPIALKLGGQYGKAAIDTTGASSSAGGDKPLVAMAVGAGQKICLNGVSNCLSSGGNSVKAEAPVRLPSYKVAALPSCNADLDGGVAYVSDAAPPAYNAPLSGGGATRTLALCNGSAWVAH